MMLLLKILIALIWSVGFAGVATVFRKKYLNDSKDPVRTVLKDEKRNFVLLGLVYAAAAVAAVFFQHRSSLSLFTLIQSVILWDALLCIAWIDIKVKKIPNKAILFLLLVRVLILIAQSLVAPENAIAVIAGSGVGMLIGAFIILACMLISRGGVGAGDMKLYAVIGFFYGLSGVMQIMMYSLFVAALCSIGMLLTKKAKLRSTLPMAPFILIGTTVYQIFLFAVE